MIWAAVFVAVVAAERSRLTPVPLCLLLRYLLGNIGILPSVSGPFMREVSELGDFFIKFSLCFEETTDNFLASTKNSWGFAGLDSLMA